MFDCLIFKKYYDSDTLWIPKINLRFSCGRVSHYSFLQKLLVVYISSYVIVQDRSICDE